MAFPRPRNPYRKIFIFALSTDFVMKIGVFIKYKVHLSDPRLKGMMDQFREAGCELYNIETREDLQSHTDLVLSVGGDGTFLSASKRVADSGIPILGVNLGRLGFLSENSESGLVDAVLKGEYTLEDRSMLYATLTGDKVRQNIGFWPYALNEVTIHRSGAAVLGINVSIDGDALPTYWADGLVVATASGSTAYSLSVGGPICMPQSKVLIIAPIAPHNLNVRPLIVPETSEITISITSRDRKATVTMDNRTLEVDPSWQLHVSMAQFSLKRIRLIKSNFVKALTSKLFWGEDIRNNGE